MYAQQIADSGTWTLGVLIGAPVAVLCLLASLAALAWGLRRRGKRYDYGECWFLIIGGAVCALATIILSVYSFWPFSADYHQWREVSGTVQQIDKRLIGNGKSMEDKFVVRFADSDGQQFGCDDTRCASIREGDSLTLSCKRAWQYTGTDGYDCRFVSTEAAR